MHEFHTLLKEWETFALLLGTAAATLAGLTFIAVTMGQRTATRQRLPILRAHLDPALLALLLTLILSAALLMPTLTRQIFGLGLILTGVAALGYMAAVFRSMYTRGVRGWDVADWTWYAVAPVVSGALLIVSGELALSSQSRAALTTAGLTLLLLLSMGVRNAWDLVTFTLLITAPNDQGDDTGHDPETPPLN